MLSAARDGPCEGVSGGGGRLVGGAADGLAGEREREREREERERE